MFDSITLFVIKGEDTGVVSSQAKPHVPFIKELLESASGKDDNGNALLTPKDISEYSAKRRVEARATNPEFSLSLAHKLVGSSKCVVSQPSNLICQLNY